MQLEGSGIVMPAKPILVLLPAVASLDASSARMKDAERSILGLGLTHRTVLAARRAGYGQIFFLAWDRPPPADTTAIPDWDRLADALLPLQAAPLVIAP